MSTVISSPSRIAAIGPPLRRLGRDVADHQAAGRAGEAAVGDHRDALAEALADDRRRHLEHLAHAGAAGRALVADHDDVAGLICWSLTARKQSSSDSKTRAGPVCWVALGAGELDHRPLGGEVAASGSPGRLRA